MEINGVTIDNTYAEAFPTWVCRIIITAVTREWARKAATEATGFATSAIGCPCEAGIEGDVPASETPDGRPGIAILICAGKKKLKEQVVERLAECVLTAPTTAVFNGITDAEEKIPVKLHFFGDGYEYQKEVGGRKCWVIPIMNGEYVGEEEFGIVKGVAGGNFFVMGENQMAALMGAQAAVEAIDRVPRRYHQFPWWYCGKRVQGRQPANTSSWLPRQTRSTARRSARKSRTARSPPGSRQYTRSSLTVWMRSRLQQQWPLVSRQR